MTETNNSMTGIACIQTDAGGGKFQTAFGRFFFEQFYVVARASGQLRHWAA